MRSEMWLNLVSIAGLAVSFTAALLMLIQAFRSSERERQRYLHIMELTQREALLRYAVEHLDELSDDDIEKLGIRNGAERRN